MIRRVIHRLCFGVLTVACVYVLTFVMVVAIPGNPVQQGERRLPPEVLQALRVRYNMDNNWLYFVQFLGGALRLDFGPSFSYPDWTAAQILFSALPVSALIGLLAILTAVGVGVPVGVAAAVRRGGWCDALALGLAVPGISVPTFVTGAVLLTVFGVWLGLAPIGGWGAWSHLPLPVITLSLPFMAYIARLTRVSMIEALSGDYIRAAAARGVPPRVIIWKHAFKPALLPVLSYLGPATAQAVTGSFVVEKVFGVPGLGQHFVNAALNRDAGLLLGSVLVFSSLLVLLNLLVDLLYAVVDPRIREAI